MNTTKNTTWELKLASSSSLKSDIRYIFSCAKKDFYKHDQILSLLKDRIYTNAKYTTLPNYIRSEIKGYIYANFDIMMFDCLEFMHWYNGIFVGKNLNFSEGFKQDLVYSNHVYKGTQNEY
jgi:hypothetical protein